MEREVKFRSYETHPWLHKSYKRLSNSDREIALSFIKENKELDRGAFEQKVNRLFLDREKPKNFSIILELLMCCNSS